MPRTGRPRSFDKDEAVTRAMQLFWERGYESTSLADLKAAMVDISAASFYAAFGSKEALFRAVLAHYLETHGQVVAPLYDPACDPRDAIEQTLRASARMQTDPAHPFGCFLVLSTATCSAESRHIQASLAEERERNRAAARLCVARRRRRAVAVRHRPSGVCHTVRHLPRGLIDSGPRWCPACDAGGQHLPSHAGLGQLATSTSRLRRCIKRCRKPGFAAR